MHIEIHLCKYFAAAHPALGENLFLMPTLSLQNGPIGQSEDRLRCLPLRPRDSLLVVCTCEPLDLSNSKVMVYSTEEGVKDVTSVVERTVVLMKAEAVASAGKLNCVFS